MNESDLLEKCPWYEGILEDGILQGDRFGMTWFEMGTSSFKRIWTFSGEKIGYVFTAQRCRSCEKLLLVKKEK